MYEAMRARAPNSTKLAGAMTTVLVTTAVGYALMNGLGAQIAKAFEEPTFLANVEPSPKPEEQIEKKELDTGVTLEESKVFIPDLDIFVVRDDGDDVIRGKTGPGVGTGKGGPEVGVAPSARPVRLSPKMLPAESPPYPLQSIRGNEEGLSRLEVCVDARGRVTSASIAASSSHPRLDDAALKWVRSARFRPGSIDGNPQVMCGHPVDYEWNLERVRK